MKKYQNTKTDFLKQRWSFSFPCVKLQLKFKLTKILQTNKGVVVVFSPEWSHKKPVEEKHTRSRKKKKAQTGFMWMWTGTETQTQNGLHLCKPAAAGTSCDSQSAACSKTWYSSRSMAQHIPRAALFCSCSPKTSRDRDRTRTTSAWVEVRPGDQDVCSTETLSWLT